MRALDTPTLLEAAQQGDNDACERLLLDNSGLIWSVARRYYGRGVDPEDLYQLGCLGFLKAVRGFDLNYGTQFSTYAVPKIAGEIRRFLRDDGTVKVSRTVKERAAALRQSRQELSQRLGREPTVGELSAATGLEPEEIAAADTAVQTVASLQSESGEDGFTLESVLGCDGMEEEVIRRLTLRQAIDSLPERERMVILLRFYKNLTQDRAAKVLQVSQVQVSRLERRAIGRLRELVGEASEACEQGSLDRSEGEGRAARPGHQPETEGGRSPLSLFPPAGDLNEESDPAASRRGVTGRMRS